MFRICPNIISNNFTTFDVEIKLPYEMYTTIAPFTNLMRIGNLPFSKITIFVDLDREEMLAFTHKSIGGADEPYAWKVEEVQGPFKFWLFNTKPFLEVILKIKMDHIELCDRCQLIGLK